MSQPMPLAPPKKLVDLEVDGKAVRAPEDATILDACRAEGIDTPTMCYADNLTPVNACRVCVVEVENARVLVPACSRTVEPGMKVKTDTPRVRTSRKLVMELLGSSVDTSLTSSDWLRWIGEYGADAERFGR
jgi:NADH dehydrogenase/NADH:ubiquinone oxidoreductase subunit G